MHALGKSVLNLHGVASNTLPFLLCCTTLTLSSIPLVVKTASSLFSLPSDSCLSAALSPATTT